MDRIKMSLATIALAVESASLALVSNKNGGVAGMLLFSFNKDKDLSIIGSSHTHEFEFTIPNDEFSIEGDIGDFTLPAKKLSNLLKNAPAGCEVSLRKEDSHSYTLAFSGLRSKFKLNSLDAADYPSFTAPTKDAAYFGVDAPEFLKTVLTVGPAMANQDVRYYLNGIQFLGSNGKLLMTATDGHRLAQNSVQIAPKKNADEFSSILSRESADSLKTWLKGVTGEIDIVLTPKFFMTRFKRGNFNCVVRSVLVDGKYPDWQRVIPNSHRVELDIDRAVFKDAASRSLILSNEKFRGLRLDFKGTELIVSSANPENESSEEIINIPQCDELTLGVNGTYLLAALNSFNEDDLSLYMTDQNTALVLKSENSDLLIVLMPMRL